MKGNKRFVTLVLALIGLAAAAGGCNHAAGLWGGLIEPIDPTNAAIDARTVLRQATEAKDAVTRCNAIEALGRVAGTQAGSVYLEALSDSSPAVRFAAAMAVGETKYAPAEERLVRMAQDPEVEPDQNAGCAVLYALHELGNDEYTYALGRLLFDDDPGVRADAATVMGRIGEPTATGPLKTLLADEQDESVRLAARTALARLGDSESKVRLRAYVKGYFLDLRLAAIPALADINPPGAQADFRFLLRKEKSPRLRVAAAGALARLGTVDEQGYDLALRSLRRPREVLSAVYGGREIADVETESMQSLAAIALGYMGRQEAIPALHEVLDSDRGAVRVAAAMAILRITNAGMGAPRRGEDDAADAAEGPVEAAPAVRPRPRMHTAGGRD